MPAIQFEFLCFLLLLIGGNAGGPGGKYFTVRSGYTMATSEQLRSIPWDKIEGAAREEAKSRVRVGVQTDTQVTAAGGFGTTLVGKDNDTSMPTKVSKNHLQLFRSKMLLPICCSIDKILSATKQIL